MRTSDVTRPVSPHSSLFALLIGIDKYMDPGVPDLRGAVNDANAVEQYLIAGVSVSKDRIVNLRDNEATRERIVTAMRKLVLHSDINAQDPILIYFSGHGSEAKPPIDCWPTTSANDRMRMFLPYDFKLDGSHNAGGQGVLDIEVSQILADIATKKSNNITVIVDCCHTGYEIRKNSCDDTLAVRGVKLPFNYTISKDILSPVLACFRGGVNSHVLLAACKEGQFAFESQGHGLFTRALLRLLTQEDIKKLTYTNVITRLPFLSSQQPQCEGVHQNRIIFTSMPGRAQPTAHDIHSTGKGEESTLEAGLAHGIANGTMLTVYSDEQLTSVVGSVVARDTDLFLTQCSVNGRRFALPEPAYAVHTLRAKEQYLRLFIDPNDPSYDHLVKVIKDDKPANVSMHPICLMNNDSEDTDLALSTHDGLVQFEVRNKICREHGLTYMPFNEVQVDESERLLSILHSAADFYWRLDLCNPNEGRSLTTIIDVECLKLTPTGSLTDDLEEILEPDGQSLNNGGTIFIDVGDELEPYGYRIHNASTIPLYAALFYFDVSDLSIGDCCNIAS
ncbi:hypothetical protein C0995_011172 [Termitomyces sp. Mi166|nr:hypothetical protein C0995_011172 [Termitomyces sp. Mi166\